ncbi:MAG: carboxypeptidase-like regulatory domain-containing protein [Rubricoccaceae bacterium]
MRGLLFLALIALATPLASAQSAVIRGSVADASGTSLPGVNVYLSGTTRGTATDAEGRFTLNRLSPGVHRIVASMIGFEVSTEDATLAAGDTLELAVELAASTQALGDVEVRAERDHRWERRFRWFRDQLLGETENAALCTIVNPHVLTFRSRWGTTTAMASEPLIIENRALGYRLTYDLEVFEGSSESLRYHGEEHFDELVPSDSGEAARWAEARETAYRGSMRHLLRSLLSATAEQDGFSLTHTWEDPLGYRASFGMPNRQIDESDVLRVDSTGWGTIRARGQLGVEFAEPESSAFLEWSWFRERRRQPNPTQHSTIRLEGGERIDPQGTPEDPFALTVSGYMAFERLADLLPTEFTGSGEIAATEQESLVSPVHR